MSSSEQDDEYKDDGKCPGLFGNHTGEGDYTVSEFSLQQRVMHFLGKKIDQQRNRLNVKICILIEAGTAVSNERATTADLQNQIMMDKYINLVRMICQDDFVSLSLQDDMCIKLFNGKRSGYTGEKLWRKFEDWRKVIRTK